MKKIGDILAASNHREFDYPQGKWLYYQEWNQALFYHWKVDGKELRKLVPPSLTLDTFKGDPYISLVAFKMQNVHPRNFPVLKMVSEFDEINIRTYVSNQNHPGVYFLSIEAGKKLSAGLAKALSGLPYQPASMFSTQTEYSSRNAQCSHYLDTTFEVNPKICPKSDLEHWLTERYCLYFQRKNGLYRYDIHHKEWKIREVEVDKLDLNYQFGNLKLTNTPDLAHYSDGVEVVAWNKVKIA